MEKMRLYSLWFCLICIIIFIFQLIIPGFTDMFVLNNLALKGQYWRFVTSILLHGSVSHLLFNLFALSFFGISLEKLIGSRRFLVVFFISGVIANIISVYFYPSSLGASGGIMGVIGTLTIIKPFMFVWSFGLILPMFLAAILWIAGDILGAFGAFGNTGIGNIAHLSGVAIGLFIGLILREWKTSKKKKIELHEGYMRLWEDKYIDS